MGSGIPAPLRLVEAFLNSRDPDSGWDELGSPGRFHAWLTVHRRVTATGPTEEDLYLARELREALRAELRSAGPGAAAPEPARRNARVRLDAIAYHVPLRARASADGVWLGPAVDGVTGVLGEILAAVVLADHDGTLRRLKVCRAAACESAFYDWSKNGSRCWCSMETCGNRSKTRAYRRRRGEARAG